MLSPATDRKYSALKQWIARKRSMLIAYSGGVDSSLLAAVTKDVLGKRSHCIFIDSPLVPRSAFLDAERIARDLGLSYEVVRVTSIDRAVQRNPPDRCYHCKKHDICILKKRAGELGLSCIADGVNLSDISEHRPGIRACDEEGVIHPFVEAGITKVDIRDIARELGFDFWDKPSSPCLSSRIPYGDEISRDVLTRVEAAEEYLHGRGIRQVRVRTHTGIARIEAGENDMPRILAMRNDLVKEFQVLGFSYITLDLEGYRSGSLDEVLKG